MKVDEFKDRIIGWVYTQGRKVPVLEPDHSWAKQQEDLFICLNCERTHTEKYVETGEYDHGIPISEIAYERAVTWNGNNLKCNLCEHEWNPHSFDKTANEEVG
jgi:hypothetical protein